MKSKATAPETVLTIELEDAATRKGWVSTLGLLAGTMQMWHFVALLGDEVRYESDTFSAPYSLGAPAVGPHHAAAHRVGAGDGGGTGRPAG